MGPHLKLSPNAKGNLIAELQVRLQHCQKAVRVISEGFVELLHMCGLAILAVNTSNTSVNVLIAEEIRFRQGEGNTWLGHCLPTEELPLRKKCQVFASGK